MSSKMGKIASLRRCFPATARAFCTAEATRSSTTGDKIVASVLFERHPVIIAKMDPIVYAFKEFWFRWNQQYRVEYPEAFLKKSDTRGQGENTDINSTPAPRITEADKTNDKKSLQRALDRSLYLLLYGSSYGSNGNPVWHFPEKVYESEPTLRKKPMGRTVSFARSILSRIRVTPSNRTLSTISEIDPPAHTSPDFSIICNCALKKRFHTRSMSNVPENSVYGGPKPQNPNKRVTLTHLRQKHKKGELITMVTAYDYPSAVHLDTAGIDICLVGDSASMVVHGHDTTLPITLDEMLVHCRAVARGAKTPLLVGDLPFGSYESSINQAVDTAVKVLKEGGMDAIKLEGGAPSRITAAKAIVEAGIAVIGHVGLTPQAISVLGGFRPQGKNVDSAVKVVETSLALQEAGCFAVVLECVPAPVAAAATSALRIPTIGIGAGPFCSGQCSGFLLQVLAYHDLLGMMQHPHHAKVTPKFCKQYARVGDIINSALLEYKKEVITGSFPGSEHSPYKIGAADIDGFTKELQKMGLGDAASAAVDAAEKIESR